jgi:hypothetical protein
VVAQLFNFKPQKSGSELPPIARANDLAAQIESAPVREGEIVRVLSEIARASEEIDPDAIMRDVNVDCSLPSGPFRKDVGPRQSELARRRLYFRKVSRQLLDRLPTRMLVRVVADLATISTDGGRKRAPILVEDIVDDYETAAKAFVERESHNVRKLVALIGLRAARGESGTTNLVRQLHEVVANWNCVTRPIQIVGRAKGLDHLPSRALVRDVRSLSAELRDDRFLATAIETVVERLGIEVALPSQHSRGLSKDSMTGGEGRSIEDRACKWISYAEFERSLSYSARAGVVFKHRLEISSTSLSWRGRIYKLGEVDGLRWGVRPAVVGVPIGPEYTVYVRARGLAALIKIADADTYSAVVDRLWRGVGARLLSEHVERLKKGDSIAFPGALIEDDAVTLFRKRIARVEEEMTLAWKEVNVLSTDRYLIIKMKGDNNVGTLMSYAKVDNLRVLEHMIGLLRAKEKSRISESLE